MQLEVSTLIVILSSLLDKYLH